MMMARIIIVFVECIIISHECDIGFSYLSLYVIRFLLTNKATISTLQQVDFIIKGNIGIISVL